jgi:hypothetical protein
VAEALEARENAHRLVVTQSILTGHCLGDRVGASIPYWETKLVDEWQKKFRLWKEGFAYVWLIKRRRQDLYTWCRHFSAKNNSGYGNICPINAAIFLGGEVNPSEPGTRNSETEGVAYAANGLPGET